MSKANITCTRHGDGYATVVVELDGGEVVTFDFRDDVLLTKTGGQARVAARYPDLLRRARLALVPA